METQELLRKVRKIEIKTRGLSNQIFSGEYHSAFKGRGMAFSEVREYQPGDEIRTIDWNVTARLGNPYVKVFEEERELTVMLMVDLSASGQFGVHQQRKKDQLIEICAVLAFSAIQNNDKIGVIFFTDQVEKFIPPKKGRTHILRSIREVLEFEPEHKGTDVAEALRYLTSAIKKRSTAFLLSDFQSADYESALKIANKKHDLVALRVFDPGELELPAMGLLPLRDLESGQRRWVNTFSKRVRREFAARAAQTRHRMEDTCRKAGVDYTHIATNQSYVPPLMGLFKKRESRR
ncbi:MAG: DUF58 domain-containing protein [Salibacteraceae bacterium]